MRAQIPTDERDRLRALYDLEVLDSPPESDFDDIVRLAAMICGTPQSVVSFIDADRQWCKSRIDGDVLNTGPCEVPREESFCAHAILGRGLIVVPDARIDTRFADNPNVSGEPGVRFYAGAPLMTAYGHALGTLSVTDAVPRRLNLGQLRALRALARQVTAQLELRRYAASASRDAARRHEIERLQDELVPLLASRLREPLSELRRSVELLRDVVSCPPELAARLGAVAHTYAPDLLRVLDNLLRMAGPAGTEPPLQRREVDLNTLADQAIRDTRPIGDAKDITVRLEMAAEPAPVLADPRRLTLALAHLLFTAIKFTPPAGQIRIRVGGDGSPTVELHDIGVHDEPARLYEHVVNGALLRSADLLGDPTGPDAGLTAVKAILDAHHASVALCDNRPEGTALHVIFPRA